MMNSNVLGNFALVLAWIAALAGIVSGIVSGLVDSRQFCRVATHSTRMVGFGLTVAICCLAYSFLQSDYTNQYVWQYSNRDMPWVYRVSAIWGGMDGSMLLWCFFHGIGAWIVSLQVEKFPRRLSPWMLATLNASLLFFASIVVFLTNPFRHIEAPFIPPDGNGL
ncbi:MAG: hypothetical protein KDD60_00860, partial [Bdellovibrionales bacterium]|nr:hypothetical protein [Bdellovibrionales bacterium]